MKKLYLSRTDRKIGGVCGGLGETYGIDSTLVRLAWVFIGLATAIVPALVTYIIAWIIIPQKLAEPGA
jgi:phage shock protein C